jgi:uncharacterized protein YndB with AHSA1/START domain
MTDRNTVHATFRIERSYDVAPERVFRAFADPEQKKKWFGGPAEWAKGESVFDFREGGREMTSGTPAGGEPHVFDARYWDIVPNERIVYPYDMHLGTRRISVSLATIEFRRQGSGTQLVFTEQGAFLDGYDDAGSREHGTGWLLDKLGASLGTSQSKG